MNLIHYSQLYIFYSTLVGEFKDVPIQVEKLSTGIYTMEALQGKMKVE